jgi:methionyl-tRNA synthetase
MKPFYITTTLPYVNADPHVGFAVELIRADIIARAKKLAGFDIFFNTGTDEHGAKIEKTAATQGVTPQAYVDEKSKKYRELLPALGILPETNFIRTTDVHHIEAAQEFWRVVSKNGFIYKKDYSIKYCVGCELEKTESELVDGRCPLHPLQEIEIIKEENYFFKFSAFQKQLLELYKSNPTFVVPDFRFNEIKSFVERGLEDFSISRLKSKMSWGIPVPDDSDQVMYVWFDALVNYVSCIGWPEGKVPSSKSLVPRQEKNDSGLGTKNLGFDPNNAPARDASSAETQDEIQNSIGQTPSCAAAIVSRRVSEEGAENDCAGTKTAVKDSFKKWWIDSGGVVQYCGKDNLRQQSAMWQAMLMAADLPPSKTIIIDGFVTGDGGIKMSKSLGNTVDPFELVKEYGTDALRYFAARELHPFEDSPFTPEKFKSAYNAGLANGLGNLVSRVMKMATANNIILDKKYFDNDLEKLSYNNEFIRKYFKGIEGYNLKEASDAIWEEIACEDLLIQENQPFKLLKSENSKDKEKGITTVESCLRSLFEISLILEPFLPETSMKIQSLIKEN